MKIHPYKKIHIKEKDLKFRQLFLSTRYSITLNIDCENLYSFSKENNFSFFNLCVAAIYKTIELIPEFKQCVICGEGREYEHLNIIIPLTKEGYTTETVCIESIHNFKSFREWNNFLDNIKDDPDDYMYKYGPESVYQGFAVLACLPGIHYASFHDMSAGSDKYFPAVYWGKYKNGEMPVTLTTNHTFVYGCHLELFFDKLCEYMENPRLLFSNLE